MKKILYSLFAVISFATLLYFIFLSPKDDVYKYEKSETYAGAMDALNYWATSRAYPDKVIPEDAYMKAYEYSEKKFSSLQKNPSSERWKQIGPHNIGGRTISISFNPQNPNTIYAGSASGGLWRSYTAGKGVVAWEYVKTGFPVNAVGAIAIPQNDSNTIYIGTGEVYGYQTSTGGLNIRTTRGSYGIGILKSTNAGLTWTKSLDWAYNQRRGVQALKINPLNPNTIYAGTTEGVFKSFDAGNSWTQIHNVIMVTDIVINPQDTNLVYAACGNLGSQGTGLYRSTNAGQTWSRMTNGLPASWGGKAKMMIYDASPNVIFASIGNGSVSNGGTWLCRTTNNGESWTVINTTDYSTYQGWFSHFVGVNPIDSSKIICGGIDVWKSTNGGRTLTRKSSWSAWFFGVTPIGGPEGPSNYSHADHHAIIYHPQNPEIIYFGNDGGVFRTLDGGETFEGCNGSYQTTQFYNGFSTSQVDTITSLGGFQDNATAVFEGRLNWRRVIGGDGTWTGISYTTSDTMFGTSQNLSLNRSVNRGLNWSGIPVPSSTVTAFVAPFAVAPSTSRILYAGRDRIFRSTNAGTSWTATNNNTTINGDPMLSMAIAFDNPNIVYVATAPLTRRAEVFRTSNGGTSWQNITGNLPNRYPVDLCVDPKNSSIAYITFSGFGTSHLFKTIDGGTNWIDIGASLPDVPTSAVIVDPHFSNHIYVGNDLGVYASTNGGATWQSFNEGFDGAALIMDLSISPINRKLRAATHGRGAYEISLLEPTVNIADDEMTEKSFQLNQNYPNPFNNSTMISWQLDERSFVTLKVYNSLGKEVATILSQFMNSGNHEINFDAKDLSSGVYYYSLRTEKNQLTRKFLLIK